MAWSQRTVTGVGVPTWPRAQLRKPVPPLGAARGPEPGAGPVPREPGLLTAVGLNTHTVVGRGTGAHVKTYHHVHGEHSSTAQLGPWGPLRWRLRL